jgi:spore germination cell wall hydrolase CwlJ-like protein
MAKYIKFLFYIVAGIFAFTVVEATSKQKFAELQAEADIKPTSIETIREKQRQLACMTQNVYWEAASEPAEGKIAVAQVVMNRVKSGQFPATPCQVIFQKSIIYEKVICQFSWACDRVMTMKPVRQDLWRESQEAAKMVLIEGYRLPSIEGALYYHADYVKPNWGRKQRAQIGRHIFY